MPEGGRLLFFLPFGVAEDLVGAAVFGVSAFSDCKEHKSNEPDVRIVYADIIRLPNWQAPTRTPMSAYERAAQYSSFNALEGYEDVVGKEAREVGQMEPLTESEMEVLNQKINLIAGVLADGHHPVLKPFFSIRISALCGGTFSGTIAGEESRNCSRTFLKR